MQPLPSRSRRDALAGALACFLMPAAGTKTAAGTSRGRDVVLVHGAWHGGWCWEPVRPYLEAAGLRVHAPTLSGLAERAAELTPDTGLETHIADIASYVESRSLTDFILVGHSYGGMVVTAVADRMKERIAHVVYLDAAVPNDGESMISYGPPRTPEDIASTRRQLEGLAPDGIAMAPLLPELLGVPKDHDLYGWVAARLTAHPLKTWLDPIRLKRGGAEGLPRTYVHCVEPVLPQAGFPYLAKRFRRDPSWTYEELRTGHDAMITAPAAVAARVAETV